jgi:hypothetical protein
LMISLNAVNCFCDVNVEASRIGWKKNLLDRFFSSFFTNHINRWCQRYKSDDKIDLNTLNVAQQFSSGASFSRNFGWKHFFFSAGRPKFIMSR